MRVAMTLAGAAPSDIVEAQVAFHLHAGVAAIVVDGAAPAVRDVLAPYANTGEVTFATGSDEAGGEVAACAPDWLVVAQPGEFWWPRAGTLVELLAAIPFRYRAVRALVRDVPLSAGDDLVGRMVVRRPGSPVTSADVLPAVERQGVDAGNTVPLRAWYPIEALRVRDTRLSAGDVAQGLADGALVADTRVSAILERIRNPDVERTGRRYLLPAELGEPLELPRPAVTDEAEYAVEVAALGEAEPEAVRRQIEELTARVNVLESGFFGRVSRRVVRTIGAVRSP